MKHDETNILFFLALILISSTILAFAESEGESPQLPSVDIQEAQESSDLKEPPTVEVQIKDNKTQQTSTLFVNSNEQLFRELQDMKVALQQIQQTLDYLVNHVIADLETENQQLRETLQRYGMSVPPATNADNLNPNTRYIPGGSVVNNITPFIPDTDSTSKMPADIKQGERPAIPPQEFSFRVVEEWGRNPEVVKELNTNAPSIKGVVGVVPPNSPREKLQELARELRQKYDEYDNINIEVFDDEASAKQYVEKNLLDKEHNVLSISKHKESGRDIITIYGVTEPSSINLSPLPNPDTNQGN